MATIPNRPARDVEPNWDVPKGRQVCMEVVHSRCCGLDVHKKTISACVIDRETCRLETDRPATVAQIVADGRFWAD